VDVLQRGSRRTAGTGVGAGLGVVLALGAGVLVGWAPQVRLDEAVSRALYAGDDRSALTGVLLEVLTTPGATWFRVVASLPVLFWLGTRRAWRTAAWVVTANAGGSAHRPAQGDVRPGAPGVRERRRDLRQPELPQRSLLGHRDAGDDRPGPGLAAAHGPAAPARPRRRGRWSCSSG